ncbi:hypothetical protein [Bartonella sp. TT121SHDZB]|uniref:hypothetical protein n=1 Tax=Bartonella sp. TT121SHDZB TaxID=3243580 RepID=UPI0035CFA1AF
MIVPDFTIFATAYISNTPLTALLALIGRESRNNVYITGDNDKLLRQSSSLRETIATSEQFKQSRHNFDVNLKQVNVEDMKWFGTFDFCKNIKAEQTALTYRYERITSVYNYKKDTLQSVLNFYNVENLDNPYMQKISSFFEVKMALLADDEMSQESIEVHEKEQEQTTNTDSLPLSKEELEDAFTHKTSSAHDAFTTENSSSLREQLE